MANPIQAPTTYLAGSGTLIGATTITVTNLLDIYGNIVTTADLGGKGIGSIEPDASNEESFTCTGITANVNGTYTLTWLE